MHFIKEEENLIRLFNLKPYHSDELFPLSDAQRECRLKQILPADVTAGLTSPIESLSMQYFKETNHSQAGHISDDVIKAIPLEYAFLPIAGGGMLK